jgi:hypothetical protein
MNPQFTKHAKKALVERTDLQVTEKQICKALDSIDNITYVKKETGSRTLCYVKVGKTIVKLSYAKKNKKVVSIYPWYSLYKCTVNIMVDSNEGSQNYEITLFPDCYMETKNNKVLTQVDRVHPDGAKEKIPFYDPDFENLFKIAWEYFKSNDKNHKEITHGRNTGDVKADSKKIIKEPKYQCRIESCEPTR